jgi:hypothetical protein
LQGRKESSRTAQEGWSLCFKRAAPRQFENVSPRPRLSNSAYKGSRAASVAGLEESPAPSATPPPTTKFLTACGRSDDPAFAGTGRGTGFSGSEQGTASRGASREVNKLTGRLCTSGEAERRPGRAVGRGAGERDNAPHRGPVSQIFSTKKNYHKFITKNEWAL